MNAVNHFIEYIELLEGYVEEERYALLFKQADKIFANKENCDLYVTEIERKEMIESINEQLNENYDDFPGFVLATATLESIDGVFLNFECCIGDGGAPYGTKGPYQYINDGFTNPDDYIEID